ncbi:MAG: hypothetical protein JNK87_34660, partial [Bryobacterales bacterium]|nr:hypothetical protein [Bryobacterales bacterium]
MEAGGSAQFGECFDGTKQGAFEAALVTVETVEGFLLGEIGEGLGFESSAGVVFEFVIEFGAGAGHFGVEGLLFHALEAGEAPGGVGDVLDDVALMDVGGLVEG